MQLQCGYLLESVKSGLESWARQNNKILEINGLIRQLSTFNITTNLDLEPNAGFPSIFAVASNIISRGLPTIPGVSIEKYFSERLRLTNQIQDGQLGKISFVLSQENQNELFSEKLFESLHAIDARFREREQYLEMGDLDSPFEEDFLLNIIPENFKSLSQMLEKQRSRESLTRTNNHGRVDFSLEIPYDVAKVRKNRYHQNVQIKHHKTYIVEVDGRKYHEDLLDELKDFEIAQLSHNVSHITENEVYESSNNFIETITSDPFFQLTAKNYNQVNYLLDPITALALSPFAIARIQRVVLLYLMANSQELLGTEQLKVAVIERDLPCGKIALEDLSLLIATLNKLSAEEYDFPEIVSTVFTTEEFQDHPLHNGNEVRDFTDFDATEFDLVIDISVLRKEGIFNDDHLFHSDNSIIIRNAHYIHYLTQTGVVSSKPIVYKPIVNILQNEVYEPIEINAELLKKLLQDIFRKTDFRPGQLPILNRAMQRKSVIGLLPTGGGKSLTYQLAAMLQPGMTIVIDPIRSLMVDQYNGLKEMGIDKCEFINSTLTGAERRYNQEKLLAKGQLQFLFVSPERFVIDEFRKSLDNAKIDGHSVVYAVIDEVHCVSEWGHDFRTPYLNLGENAQLFCPTYDEQPVPLFGLTATASFDVLADIERELLISDNDGNSVVRFENTIRDEINYQIKETSVINQPINFFSEKVIREHVGRNKQVKLFEIISEKFATFSLYNNENTINSILQESFLNYLGTASQQKYLRNNIKIEEASQTYANENKSRLLIQENPFLIQNELYNYGIIVFMPHRTGWMGIRNGFNTHGVFDNPSFIVVNRPENEMEKHFFGQELLGYFMGSSDDENAAKIDEESFMHLDLFKHNKESVMVATKAFGMGIDKPNVRMTIHFNIPSSIESFVQESGRGGRDGKVSVSYILFNNDQFPLADHAPETYNADKDILMYFHNNAFKGQIKERVMIYELRNHITYPNTTNLQMLIDEMNDLFVHDEDQFLIKLGRNNHHNRIFINTIGGQSVGYVYLDTQQMGTYDGFGTLAFRNELVTWLASNLPFAEYNGVDAIRQWLERVVVNLNQAIGIERMLSEMEVGEEKHLFIPFTNKYYSKEAKAINFFTLNESHFQIVRNTVSITSLIENGILIEGGVRNVLKEAVFNNLRYDEFIDSLNIGNEQANQNLRDQNNSWCKELQKAFYVPRAKDDTAKAIYRLTSIGIIDSYTIDYQNNIYKVNFKKKEENSYFNALEKLISRYTSRRTANKEIENLKQHSQPEIDAGTATTISKCLEYLTGFIYDKIMKKRHQAIGDMMNLCNISITIPDPLVQSQYIKDEIYYYFNAKYSRKDFIEQAAGGDLPASLPNDLDDELPVKSTIEKYISLTQNIETGEFISNIKHLRGSTMRMLRSYPDKQQYRILKSFSLFILADTITSLIGEAKEELIKGLKDWKLNEDLDFNFVEFILYFKTTLKEHIVNYDIDTEFNEIEDLYYSQFYSEWLNQFSNHFLTKTN